VPTAIAATILACRAKPISKRSLMVMVYREFDGLESVTFESG
jgi:hypothetical protein